MQQVRVKMQSLHIKTKILFTIKIMHPS